MSINKFIASAVNGALEIQPALANINLDFSLFKVTPPQEFEGVGAAMTTFRKDEAENGRTHKTARKLGALFEKLTPSTPSLIKAYGKRASEIASSSKIDEDARQAYGAFASRVGADTTSLWAAATSGNNAISIHLLACLLARMWDPAEAISIWVQIVEKRRQDINKGFEQGDVSDIATCLAAQQELSRSQLSEWDASARAWLAVADNAKIKQQRQLKLIIDNLPKLYVNQKEDVSDSVLNAWSTALLQMEALICGVSQEAQGGEIILGLSSWHLYPDMMVLIPRLITVQQNDDIFARGGALTVGNAQSSTTKTGIHWSLPLAHLRRYGHPVMSAGSIDGNSNSRVSTNELLMATLGCVLQGWGEVGKDTLRAITWLDNVSNILHKAQNQGSKSAKSLLSETASLSWFSLLLAASKRYVKAQGYDRIAADKLILIGRKHAKDFLGRPGEPLFGLTRSSIKVQQSNQDPASVRELLSVKEDKQIRQLAPLNNLSGDLDIPASTDTDGAHMGRRFHGAAKAVEVEQSLPFESSNFTCSAGYPYQSPHSLTGATEDGLDDNTSTSQYEESGYHDTTAMLSEGQEESLFSFDQFNPRNDLQRLAQHSISEQIKATHTGLASHAGIGRKGNYVGLIATTDDKIQFLRAIAEDLTTYTELLPAQVFIRYKREYSECGKHIYEYCTALPCQRNAPKRTIDNQESGVHVHKRWLYAGGDLHRNMADTRFSRLSGEAKRFARMEGDRCKIHANEKDEIQNCFLNRQQFYSNLGEDIFKREDEKLEDYDFMNSGIRWDSSGSSLMTGMTEYKYLYGDEDSAALFLLESKDSSFIHLAQSSEKETAAYLSLFETAKIDPVIFADTLFGVFLRAGVEGDPHLKALKAVSTTAALYQRFSNTTVALKVLQRPLWNTLWVQKCFRTSGKFHELPLSLSPYTMSRASAFACIAMFESGTYDIDPKLLEDVVAMSTNDSIYIGAALLTDPHEQTQADDIRRVSGNIGKSGMAFMIPPTDPMIKKADLAEWRDIGWEKFDGCMRDCFEGTSLHLSFTGASSTINTGFSGGQDVEVYLLETLISARDRGSWIADLDISRTAQSTKLMRMEKCEHPDHLDGVLPSSQIMTAINNWLGLIDAPEASVSIVSAHRNWQARLATSSVSVASGNETLVLPTKPCWSCFATTAEQKSWGKLRKIVLIG